MYGLIGLKTQAAGLSGILRNRRETIHGGREIDGFFVREIAPKGS